MEVNPPASYFGRIDWRTLPLSDLYEFKNGVNAEREAYGKGVPFINVLEAITFSHLQGHEIAGRVSLAESTVAAYEVRKGDLLFNRTSETEDEVGLAAAYVGSERVVFGGFVIRARPLGNEVDSRFAAYALRAPMVRSQIIAMGQGAVRANIGQDNLRRVELRVPPIKEQRAIAQALTDADALIGSLEQLLTKKRQIKQGAMQELLTGKRRLPGFDVQWQLTLLGSVLRLQVGFPFPSMGYTGSDRGWRLVRNRDLKADDDIVHFGGPFSRDYLIGDGDLLVGMDGDFLPCRWQNGDALLNQRVGRVVHSDSVDLAFVSYLLVGKLKEIDAATGSTTVKHLSHGDVENLVALLPPVMEQAAIAGALSDLDADLAATEARLAKARDVKQAMMQVLLTGRIRLIGGAASPSAEVA